MNYKVNVKGNEDEILFVDSGFEGLKFLNKFKNKNHDYVKDLLNEIINSDYKVTIDGEDAKQEISKLLVALDSGMVDFYELETISYNIDEKDKEYLDSLDFKSIMCYK